jgi:HK97 family phage prohead protease
MELLKFSNDIEASDSERRIIAGKIVPYATEIGNTSAGKVIFAADSIEIPANKKIKLLDEHNPKAILGSATTFSTSPEGIHATFKVTKTARGDEALTLASDGLKTGLSVGVEPVESSMNKDGVIVVTKGILREVSHVGSPAFQSAEITRVAASEETPEAPTPTNESEAVQVEDTTKDTVAPEAVETPSVEASRPTVTASVAYTKPRIEVTKRNYLENTLKANLFQDDEARQWIKAADNDQSSAAGFIPTPQSNVLLNFLSNADRPLIDSISSGAMPAYGKTFELPKITAVPTVDQIDENQPVAESNLDAEYITVTKKSFKGRGITTLELISNSTPAYLDEFLRQLEVAYAKDTETYVTGEVANFGALNATPAANSATGILGYVSSAAAAIYKASLGFAKNIVVTPEQWANIMSYNDNGRPIYIASNPMNNAGALAPDSVTGTVAGLQLRVSRYIAGAGGDNTADYSMVIVNPEAYTWYEDTRQQLRTNINSDGTVDVLLFGQGALATKLAAGANWFNKS